MVSSSSTVAAVGCSAAPATVFGLVPRASEAVNGAHTVMVRA
jgi:hypothetical protein